MEKGHGKGLYTILGEGTEFEGSIVVPHNIRVDGVFKGKIDLPAIMKGKIWHYFRIYCVPEILNISNGPIRPDFSKGESFL